MKNSWFLFVIIAMSCVKKTNTRNYINSSYNVGKTNELKKNKKEYALVYPTLRVAPLLKNTNPVLDTNDLYKKFSVHIYSKLNDTVDLVLEDSKYERQVCCSSSDGLFISLKYFDNEHELLIYKYNSINDTLKNIYFDRKNSFLPITIRSIKYKTFFTFKLRPVYHAYRVKYDSMKVDILFHRYDYAYYE